MCTTGCQAASGHSMYVGGLGGLSWGAKATSSSDLVLLAEPTELGLADGPGGGVLAKVYKAEPPGAYLVKRPWQQPCEKHRMKRREAGTKLAKSQGGTLTGCLGTGHLVKSLGLMACSSPVPGLQSSCV